MFSAISVSLFLTACTFLASDAAPIVTSLQLHQSTKLQPPYFFLYTDSNAPGDLEEAGPPPIDKISGSGTNSYQSSTAIAFLGSDGPSKNDTKVAQWQQLGQEKQKAIKKQYQAYGIKLVAAAFGTKDLPTSRDPVATAVMMAKFVKDNNLDGIDVDYEDYTAFDLGTAEDWLIKFTTELRKGLPHDEYLLSHAPMASLFSPSKKHPAGAYVTVHSKVGNLIDFYNVQFYNHNKNEYTDCKGLLFQSSSEWPLSSLFEIADTAHVPLNKLVITKGATPEDAGTGFTDTATLAGCLKEAQDAGKGWKAGVSVWQYPHANTKWIQDVRSKAFPVQ